MTKPGDISAAVIGTGFIGGLHVEVLRRMGVHVTGVLGSSPERGAERAPEMGVARSYDSLDDLVSDETAQVVHVTSPNDAHFGQVKACLAAGKHVVCEKPLTVSSAESAELVRLAGESERVCAVNYNIRFYPLNQHARAAVAAGELGDVRLISGHYLQDWMMLETDWNWRIDPARGGRLRAVGDIGTHWIDLTTHVAGQRLTAVMADLATFLPTRQQPAGPVETFASAGGGESVSREIETEDAATILLRYANGARGAVVISQVSPGRKNALSWEIDGSRGAAAWNSETPDHLWLGHRERPNAILQRDAALMHAAGGDATVLPGGHVEGFADSFHSCFRDIYRAIAAGRAPEAPAWATFEDGHEEMLICDAILTSAAEGRWVEIARG